MRIMKGNHDVKKTESPKPRYHVWSSVRFLLRLAWTSGEKKVILLGLLSAALAVTWNLVSLYVSPTILSAVERRVSAAELSVTIAGFTLGLMLVSAAAAYVNTNVLFGRISVRAEIMNLLNAKAATTSHPNVDDDTFTKLLAKSRECTYSSMGAAEATWTTLTTLATNLLGFFLYASLLTTVQPLLILVIFVTTAASFSFGHYVNGYGYRHREEEAEYGRHMDYLSRRVEDLSAAKDIRLFGLRPWLEDLYEKAMDCHTAFHKKVQGVFLWASLADLILMFLRNAVAYAYLISLVDKNGLSVAEFLLYFTAAGGFAGWVTGILNGFGTLYKQSLDLSTVRECLAYHEPFLFDGGRRLKADAEKKYELRLEGVSFRYPGADRNTLTNVNLTLHPGEKLAVVGLNGAGKTTLIKLICGFLDPTEGRVLLDGRDVRDFNRADYYTMFSAVFQDFSLLAGTIATNVAQAIAGIDMGRVKECVEKAGLRDKVEALPDGYETYLNREVYEEATMLSGGETQRLMLARALYKNAPFLILDEPTAALDPIAESEMYQKYHEVTAGKSSVYISHRLASTRFCDRILLIDDAGICEEGTHEELLRLGGRYAGLYAVQSKYYREGEA